MRRLLLITMLMVSAISCTKGTIRRMAIEHETTTALNGIVEMFIRSYWSTPTSIEDLKVFTFEFCGLYDYYDSLYTANGYAVEELLTIFNKNSLLKIASYKDSVFLYSSKYKIGTCVYGTPQYWFDHPEKYPKDRWDYWDNFKLSGFDGNGHFIFDSDYEKLQTIIQSIWNRYKTQLYVYRYDGSSSSNGRKYRYMPAYTLVTIDIKKNVIRIYPKIEKKDVYIKDIEFQHIDSDFDFNKALNTFLEDVKNDVVSFGKENDLCMIKFIMSIRI